jgi:His/Glu/Gln/Arg/opine family amino acid ABC transporter permease subunit
MPMFQAIWEKISLTLLEHERYMYIIKGLGNTLLMAACAVLIGTLIGLLVAAVKVSPGKSWLNKAATFLADCYLTVIRGTPTTVQLMIIYFVIFSSITIDKVLVSILAFGINSGAYVAEIIRSGILAVDRGQMEAGRSLGLDYKATMRHIILPQALKNILPALGNEFIVLLKETSVAGFIGTMDLTKAGDIIKSQTYEAMVPLLAVAAIYLVIVMFMTAALRRFEGRLRKSDHR